MMELLLEPFSYQYMVKAIALSAAVGGMCAFLSGCRIRWARLCRAFWRRCLFCGFARLRI